MREVVLRSMLAASLVALIASWVPHAHADGDLGAPRGGVDTVALDARYLNDDTNETMTAALTVAPSVTVKDSTLASTYVHLGAASGFPSIWVAGAATPTTGNYAILAEDSNTNIFNSPGTLKLRAGNVQKMSIATTITMDVKASMTSNATTCTLNAGSPSTCTATVTASAMCVCANVGATAAIANNGCAVSLSGTTLTVTSANAANNVVNIWCDR